MKTVLRIFDIKYDFNNEARERFFMNLTLQETRKKWFAFQGPPRFSNTAFF